MKMGTKSNVVVGLDIGTTLIVVVVAQIQPDGKLDIIGVGTAPSRGLRKGVVINIEATVQSISKAIEQAEMMAGTEIDSVFAAISGSHIRGFNSHGIVGIRNKEVSAHDVEKVIDAAKAVAIPLDREILHVLPQEFIIDEQDGIREPLGISGVRLEARVHIVTGAIASAQNVVKCANRCGLTVQDIVLGPLASAKAVLAPEEQELGVCVVDIGGGTSDIIVFHGGSVRHTSVISVGGGHITNDIAAGLRTPIGSAEEMKCRHGMALASLVSRDETIEVPSTGGRPPRVISKQVLAEIIEPRVSELFHLIRRDLDKAGVLEICTSGMVLTGGAASLKGMCELAEQICGVPVRLGSPSSVGGLSDIVRAPEYAVGVGLAIHGAQLLAKGKTGAGRGVVSRLIRKVNGFFSEYF